MRHAFLEQDQSKTWQDISKKWDFCNFQISKNKTKEDNEASCSVLFTDWKHWKITGRGEFQVRSWVEKGGGREVKRIAKRALQDLTELINPVV